MTMEPKRLSDRILFALQLALEQGDMPICEHLRLALEESLTRNAGGKDFTERREFAKECSDAFQKLSDLREKS